MSWRIGLSSGSCTDTAIKLILPALHASGARGIEVGTPPRHFDPLQPGEVAALQTELAQLDLEPVSIHAPFGGPLDLAEPNPHFRNAAVGAVWSAADAIKRLGGSLVIVHPSDLVRHATDARARLRDAVDSLRILTGHCRESGLRLVIETPLPHLVGGHPDELAWLLGEVDESVGVCIDTGHAALGKHWSRFLEVAGPRLAHIHAHDNHGHRDDHLAPGDGTIDWAEIRRDLASVNFSQWIMLELMCPTDDPHGFFKRAFEQAMRLLPPG